MGYEFDTSKFVWWSWLEMVAQLRYEDLVEVVQGPDGRSRGLIQCFLAVRPNRSYDHPRHFQKAKAAMPDPVKKPNWDFMLLRDDGSGVRLHPSWNENKVKSFSFKGSDEPVWIPAVLGGSWGRGTYKHLITIDQEKTYRFDPQKCPPFEILPWR